MRVRTVNPSVLEEVTTDLDASTLLCGLSREWSQPRGSAGVQVEVRKIGTEA
jgi:hypothetical protein